MLPIMQAAAQVYKSIQEGHFTTVGQRQGLSLRTRTEQHDGHTIALIEQNPLPSKVSEGARLARAGHEVFQVKDETAGRYVGMIVDGVPEEY